MALLRWKCASEIFFLDMQIYSFRTAELLANNAEPFE